MKPRSVQIEPVDNGYVVRVGCKVLVFAELNALLVELENYLKDPVATEKAFMARYGWPEQVAIVDVPVPSLSFALGANCAQSTPSFMFGS